MNIGRRQQQQQQQQHKHKHLDLSINRSNNNLYLGIYRKPTQTDATLHFTSNHPLEHKLTA